MSDLAKVGLFVFTPFTPISQICGWGDKAEYTDTGSWRIFCPGNRVWRDQVREYQVHIDRVPVADPIKLFFFDNEEFVRFRC